MSEENKKPESDDTSAEGTSPETQTESKPKERTFTQSQLDELIVKAKQQAARSERKRVLKEIEGREPSKEDKGQPPSDNDALEALRKEVADMKRDAAFAEALSRVPGASELTDLQRQLLKPQFDPSEPDALKEVAIAVFGGAKKPEPEPKADEGLKVTTMGNPPGVPQHVSAGAPSAGDRRLETIHPKEWTHDEIMQMKSQRTEDGRSLLRATIEKWAQSLPGGNPNLFRARIPKG